MEETTRKQLALCDLSWMVYKNRHALSTYGFEAWLKDGSQTFIRPTGHVLGTVNNIISLSKNYDLVILAVDSYTQWRKDRLPEYKTGRHTPTGDPNQDFPVRSDLPTIIGLCTYLKNVVFIQKSKPDGHEADDIIASILQATRYPTNDPELLNVYAYDVSLFAVDADLLVTPGNYLWYRNFNEPPTDREAYILRKFQIARHGYLPHLYKVVRGDSSDKIPVGIPYFPTRLLASACEIMNYTASKRFFDLDQCISILQSVGKDCKGKVSKHLDDLADPNSATYKRLSVNYDVTKPWFDPVKITDLQKSRWTLDKVKSECEALQLHNLIPVLEYT